ncbi:WD repeat-containing protein 7-like, partial [Frankliniella occidentalis]|uniref:WD repeat-containing protein 7-like n=1 Tax=Frankliniella occidentalis TaxID=133901 RepID=A0A9C6XVF9_FRAOC
MEIAQLLLSLLHAWGMEPELDRVCETKLGLLRPMVPVSFGVISKGGYMSLLLPTWKPKIPDGTADPVAAVVSASPTPPPRPPPPSQASLSGHQHQPPPGPAPSQAQMVAPPPGPARKSIESELPREMVQLERLTRLFTARTHWELSTTLTTNHLLATISLAYTLMSMNNATFVTEQERSRILHRQSTRTAMTTWSRAEEETEEQFTAQQAHIKQGWSRLATLHCVQLPDKVTTAGSRAFKRPQVEMMARRWQHHCLEVRQAAQALLLAELERLGPKGRKALVDSWAPFLPMYAAAEQQAGGAHQGGPGAGGADSPGSQGHSSPPQHPDTPDYAEEEEEGAEELCVRKPSSAAELKRKQTTAVVLLGVIGAEFGQDMGQEPVSAAPTPTASSGPTLTAAPPAPANNKRRSSTDVRRKSSVVEGFGLGNNNLARLT